MAIIPVPTTRSSDVLLQSRLLQQLQLHQLDLLRVQDRLSTGLRFTQPSDDSAAASRAMRLQALLEQKKQSAANLRTTNDYLTAADATVSHVSGSLIEIRGLAISALNTTSSDVERNATVTHIRRAVDQMTQVANSDFRGRFLFAGSKADTTPFTAADGFVAFQGNDKRLPSYVDLNVLVDANLTADEVFGVYSSGVLSDVDFNPVLTADMRLADLKQGAGIRQGSFVVTDGQNSSTIDIGQAVTVGDLVRLLEDNPPAGRQIVARVTSNGLSVELADDENGGSLAILEVQGGTTAAELGILQTSGAGVDPIVGSDLNPRLLPTTRLENVLGVRASGFLRSDQMSNDLFIEAVRRGADGNNWHVHLVDDSLLQAAPGISGGNEFVTVSDAAVAARAALTFSGSNNNLLLTANTAGDEFNQVQIEVVDAGVIGNSALVSYDADNKRLTIGIDSLDQTQIQTVVAAINSSTPFTASYDNSLAGDGGYVPTAAIVAADAGVVTGNTGNSGGDANTIFVNVAIGETTANDVRAAIAANPAAAELIRVQHDEKDAGNGIAAGDGLVTAAAVALSGGSGVEFDQASGFQITSGGQTYVIDLGEAETIEDLLNIVNGSGANVLAEINADGSAINIRSRLSGSDLSIGENGGATASQLGLRTFTAATRLEDLNHGLGVDINTGIDFSIVRNDGVQLDIDLTGAETIQDVLDIINSHPGNLDPEARVVAQLAAYGNGIELADLNTEGPGRLTVIKRRSLAAVDLGFIPAGAEQATSTTAAVAATATVTFPAPNHLNTALVFTSSLPGVGANDVEIRFINSGAVGGNNAVPIYDPVNKILSIDINPSATTANAVLAAFAPSPDFFTVALDTSSDPTNNGTGVIGFTGTAATTSGGEAEVLRAADVNPHEVNGVFNTLIKLAEAIDGFDVRQMTRLMEQLEADIDRLSFARAEMGSRGQFLDTLQARIEDENIELRTSLSDEIDADLAETISELTVRQAAMQASLQLIGRAARLSLLDFI